MRTVLGLAAAALLGAATAAPSSPQAPPKEAECGQSEVGVVKKRDARTLLLKVTVGCKEQPRVSFLGIEVGVKCLPQREEVSFRRAADGSKDYRVIGPVADRKCCAGRAELPIKDLQQVQQICAGTP